MAPGSPFYKATNELWTDVALRNISLFSDMGDRGSGNSFGNGLIERQHQPRQRLRGDGWRHLAQHRSARAGADATLAEVSQKAMAGDLGTLWKLAAGGLTQMPGAASAGTAFVETIWNTLLPQRQFVRRSGQQLPDAAISTNNTSGGGADPGQPIPQYQLDYGLLPVTNDPYHLPGRGNPDVSANAGSNMTWLVPGADMNGRRGRQRHQRLDAVLGRTRRRS